LQLQDAGLDQPAQAIVEDAARRARLRWKSPSGDAVEGIADHQQCPAITEQVGAAGNGAGTVGVHAVASDVVAV
jgi:hypothetical protein